MEFSEYYMRGKEERWHAPGKYWVSQHNFVDEVVADYEFPEKVVICDSTIRKLDMNPGAPIYSVEDKLEIATLLNDMGIRRLGCNPVHFYGTARNRSAIEGIRAIAKKGLNFKLAACFYTEALSYDRPGPLGTTGARGEYEEHIDRVVDMGCDSIEVMFPNLWGGHHDQAGWDWDSALGETTHILEYVRSKGVEACVGMSDIGRLDIPQAVKIMNYVIDHGAELLFISDSLGSLSPQATRYFFKATGRELVKKVPVVYHVHDDYGLATAQSIAAVAAGCWPDVSTNGIGERAFANLDEVVLSLELLYGVDTGIKLEKLTELAKLVERVSGFKNPLHKPIVGETMHVPLFLPEYMHLIQGGSYVFSSFVPELVGKKWAMIWWDGMLTAETVRAKLEQLGLRHEDKDVAEVLKVLGDRLESMREYPAWLRDSEVDEICRQLVT